MAKQFRDIDGLSAVGATSVTQRKTVMNESALSIGVFWPTGIYEKRFKRPAPQPWSQHTHCGRSYEGVILGDEHGNPPGTFHLRSIDQTSGSKQRDIADPEDKESVAAKWAAVQERSHVDVRVVKKGRMQTVEAALPKQGKDVAPLLDDDDEDDMPTSQSSDWNSGFLCGRQGVKLEGDSEDNASWPQLSSQAIPN